METIRKNCFETNSSSTHTLTMCMKSDYKKWENGELYYYPYNHKLITPERMEKIVRSHMLDTEIHCDYNEKTITYNGKTIAFDGTWKDSSEKAKEFYTTENLNKYSLDEVMKYRKEHVSDGDTPMTREEYLDETELETYKEDFTTDKGEEIVAFGTFGQDY